MDGKCERGEHDRIYAGHLVGTNRRPWVCRACLARGEGIAGEDETVNRDRYEQLRGLALVAERPGAGEG
jgi:hypothetical protein